MTAADARALFAATYGAEPTATYSAPGRVNLIGEHTDYNEGFVLPFAIGQRTQAAVAPRTDDLIRVVSTFSPDPVDVRIADLDHLFPTAPGSAPAIPEWAAYPVGVAWALRETFPDAPATGMDLAFASDVPIGAGLSSSAAIEAAAGVAFAETWGLDADGVTLARAGRRAENDAVGAPTGIMDQMAVNLGRADAAIFLDCRTLDANVVDLGFADADLTILVIDTGVKHQHATGGYRDRRDSCELGAKLLGVPSLRDVSVADLDRTASVLDEVTFRRVRHIVTENARVLETVRTLREAGPTAIGDLLVASHASMRDDFEISVPELDTAVQAAMSAGAIGARMTGGGFGGAAIALVRTPDVDQVSAAAREAFAAAGFAAPTIFTVTPSAGPTRDA